MILLLTLQVTFQLEKACVFFILSFLIHYSKQPGVWIKPVTQWWTCWVDPTKSFSSSSALLYHQFDWRHTILKPSLRSSDGYWSMPSIAEQQAGGTPGSSIWSPGFSRTHTACGAAGLAGPTSVCDVQAGWMSRPSTQPTSQLNVLPKWTSFRNMWVNISVISFGLHSLYSVFAFSLRMKTVSSKVTRFSILHFLWSKWFSPTSNNSPSSCGLQWIQFKLER